MSVDERKALVRRVFEEAYGKGNVGVIGEFLAPDVVAWQNDQQLHGIEEIRSSTLAYLAAFPDQRTVVQDLVAEDDKVVVRYTTSGTHTGETEEYGPPTGKRVEVQGVTIYRFVGDTVAEAWDMTASS